jgi:hypothetical protein
MRHWWWPAVPCCGVAGTVLANIGMGVFTPGLDIDTGWLIIEIALVAGAGVGVWIALKARRRAARGPS